MADHAVRLAASAPAARSYSNTLRPGLFALGLVIALLPIPVTALGLLPAYWVQARFLVFYAPVVCLLTLGYLFYLRESLARLLFIDLLNPYPEPNPYYPENPVQWVARNARRLRSLLLTMLPALLLATSVWCFSRYTQRLRESVDLATSMSGVSELSSVLAAQPGDSAQPAAPVPVPPSQGYSGVQRDTALTAPKAVVHDTASAPHAPPSRQEVLRTTVIDRIPMFASLSALYIGIFVSAMMAVMVMALKEYAIEAMGLSEEALVLGVRGEEGEEDGEMETMR